MNVKTLRDLISRAPDDANVLIQVQDGDETLWYGCDVGDVLAASEAAYDEIDPRRRKPTQFDRGIIIEAVLP